MAIRSNFLLQVGESPGVGDRTSEQTLVPSQVLGSGDSANMSTVLDQKNYIEELNRHLK